MVFIPLKWQNPEFTMGFWPVDSVHKKENNLNYYPRRPSGGTGVIISSLLTWLGLGLKALVRHDFPLRKGALRHSRIELGSAGPQEIFPAPIFTLLQSQNSAKPEPIVKLQPNPQPRKCHNRYISSITLTLRLCFKKEFIQLLHSVMFMDLY